MQMALESVDRYNVTELYARPRVNVCDRQVRRLQFRILLQFRGCITNLIQKALELIIAVFLALWLLFLEHYDEAAGSSSRDWITSTVADVSDRLFVKRGVVGPFGYWKALPFLRAHNTGLSAHSPRDGLGCSVSGGEWKVKFD